MASQDSALGLELADIGFNITDPDQVRTTIELAREASRARGLTAVESFYLGCALSHAGNDADQDEKPRVEQEAFEAFRAAFFDSKPGVPEKLSGSESRNFPGVDRVRIGEALLDCMVKPRASVDRPEIADLVASYLWTVDDNYRPSMFGYAVQFLSYTGDTDAEMAAGLLLDLIRRGSMDDRGPAPAAVIQATQALKKLARDAKSADDADLASEYQVAARVLKEGGEWQTAITSPGVDKLLSEAVDRVKSHELPDLPMPSEQPPSLAEAPVSQEDMLDKSNPTVKGISATLETGEPVVLEGPTPRYCVQAVQDVPEIVRIEVLNPAFWQSGDPLPADAIERVEARGLTFQEEGFWLTHVEGEAASEEAAELVLKLLADLLAD